MDRATAYANVNAIFSTVDAAEGARAQFDAFMSPEAQSLPHTNSLASHSPHLSEFTSRAISLDSTSHSLAVLHPAASLPPSDGKQQRGSKRKAHTTEADSNANGHAQVLSLSESLSKPDTRASSPPVAVSLSGGAAMPMPMQSDVDRDTENASSTAAAPSSRNGHTLARNEEASDNEGSYRKKPRLQSDPVPKAPATV